MRAALSARLRRAADRLDPPPPPPPPPVYDWTRRDTAADARDAQPVTDLLAARLLPADEAAVVERLEGWAVEAWDAADAAERRRLLLWFGVYVRLPGVLERTGLVPDEPPEDVHAMARGALAAGGDYASADLVVAALERAGGAIASVRRALDFGCSSGRTVRPLAAAYPHVQWHGVDPNGPAIAWAAEHVPGVAFARSASEPPLAFGDGELDLVYAISIWSHFAEDAARRWLDEMHRVVAPGGHLVITIHGAESVAHLRPPRRAAARAARRDRQAAPRARILVRAGVRRRRRPWCPAPGLGHGVHERGVAAARGHAGLAGRRLRGRAQRRQPGRRRAAARAVTATLRRHAMA